MKKKILFIIDSLNCGGAEKSLVSLLPLLDYQKYDIDLMMISRGGTFEQFIPSEVNIINYIPHKSGLPSYIFFKFCLLIFSLRIRFNNLFGIKRHGAETYWSTVGRAIAPLKQKYDIAIAYQQGFPTYYVAQKVTAQKKIAWVNTDITHAGYRKSFNQRFYDIYNHIIPVSKQLETVIVQEYDNIMHKTTVIYDILNNRLIKQLAQSSLCTNNKVTFTTVARLTEPKGHSLAIDAAKELKNRGLDFIWQFIGDGPLRTNIKRRITECGLEHNIMLLGEQSNPYPYIQNCDIYVQTSIFEGFGLTIGEAKILHKPIVSTNFKVIHNQLTNGVNGIIVSMNGKDIANAIVNLLTDADLKTRLIDNLTKENNNTIVSEPQKLMQLLDS